MVTFSQLKSWGRLGNNMFQVAAVIGTAHRCNSGWIIPPWEWSKYFIGPFNQGEINPGPYHREPAFHYNPIHCFGGDLDLRGYYQSRRYWEHCEEEIKRVFAPSEQVLQHAEERVKNQEVCGVHIRRGDYVTTMKHYYCNLWEEGYYNRALEDNTLPLFVFSDDIDWCRRNIKADYYGDGNAVEDLFTFAKCSRKIMANSSWSWWGAYLGGGEVTAPKQWFKPVAKHNTSDLYINTWKLI